MKKIATKLRFSVFVFIMPLFYNTAAQAQTEPASVVFWNELQKLCGKAFAGTVAAAPADDTTFKDKALVMHVRQCQKDRIRIPFVVGTDRSRTWVLTRKGDRIELRHDHRHEDGKPDKVTMYGGWTTSGGMPTRQMFPADQQTVDVIAAAATNVWWIDIVPGEHLSYNLRRMGSERFFSIKFDVKTPVKAPEAPWGWKDSDSKLSSSKKIMNKSLNPVVYFEIPVTDINRAIKFYSTVFKCVFEKNVIDKNEMALFPFTENGTGISGALAKGEIYKPTKEGTLIYFKSNNIDHSLSLVQRNGGKILYPKTSIGELGFVAEFEDSEGNRIALHTAVE
ncbi:MAG: VOC family protein [Pyrinomonadaceae bacterium]